MVVTILKDKVTIFLIGQIIIVFTCKPHLNHTYSLYIITLPIFSCISAVEKDRDSIFTTVTTLRKPGFGQKLCSVNWPSTHDATSKNFSYTLDNS